MSWLTRLFRRRRLDRELDRELSFHLEEQTRDLIAAGMPPAEAARRARIELGGVEQVKEEARDARGTRWIEEWWNDTRYAIRTMRRTPGFTAAAVLTLALGIGANTAVFSVVRALMLQSLPVEDPGELVLLGNRLDGNQEQRFSGPSFERYREALPTGARLAAAAPAGRMYASQGEAPEVVTGQLVSGEWFSLLGVRMFAGRSIGQGDDRPGADPVVVLSHEYWGRRFGWDPSLVGRTIRVNGAPLTVIGIAEPAFAGVVVGLRTDLWIPLGLQETVRYASNASISDGDAAKPWYPQEGIRWLNLFGRVPEDVSRQSVESRLRTAFAAELTTQLATVDSATREYWSRSRLDLVPAARGQSTLRESFGDPLLVLMVTVGLVLLVACANLASLLLARSAARSHEIAVRMSLGARRGRLFRQVLTESLTLALIGGLASLLVGWWGGAALLRMAASGPASVPLDLSFDWRLLGFVTGVSLVTGVGFGLAPALRMARTDLHDTFKTGGRVTGDRRGREWPLGRILVVGQVGLSLALVVVATVFVRSTRRLLEVDPGYQRTSVLEVRLDTRAAGYPPSEMAGLRQRLLDAVRAVPGVRSASVSLHGVATGSARTSSIEVPGQSRPPNWDNSVQVMVVSPEFFETLGIRLARGRLFAPTDRAGAPRVAIVNEATARRFFETEDPVGRRFGYDAADPEFEVVGVVPDLRVNELRADPPPTIFVPIAQEDESYITSLEVRAEGAAAGLGPAVRRAITSVDPGMPIREVVTIAELLERGLRQERMLSRLTGVFGLLAALLAAIGLYGVMSYSVARRSSEIGVRLALGATPATVRGLVLRDTFRLVGAGLVIGGLILIPALNGIEKLVFGISPRDPGAIGLAVAILALAGLAAGGIPAWRAARLDPVAALRKE